MADLTIHELQNEATSPAANDYMVLDGATAGTRKITPANLAAWIHDKWAAFVNALTSKTSFASGDKIPVVNGSTATAMEAANLLELTAQNALAGNVATTFIENSTNALAGHLYSWEGKTYVAKENYNGSWDASKFNLADCSKVFFLEKDAADIVKNNYTKVSVTLTEKKVITKQGVIQDYNNIDYYITDYIDVSAYDKILVTCASNFTNSACVFYNADYSVNKVALYNETKSGATWNVRKNVVLDVPFDAKYVVLAGTHTTYIPYPYIYYKSSTEIKEKVVVDGLKNDVSDIVNNTLSLIPTTHIQNKLLGESGNIQDISSDGYYITDYIDVSAFDKIWVDCACQYTNAACSFFYDDYSVCEVAIKNETSSGNDWNARNNVELSVPAGAKYVVLSGTNVGRNHLPIARHKNGVQIKKMWEGKKWCCVGDSLTEINNATSKNYAEFVSNETGIEIVNMGVGGSGYKRKSDENKAFYQRISNVPVDSDVVTIFGSGNDLNYVPSNIGTATDTGTTTLAGCINTTIDNLYAVLPAVHLGIVAPTPWKSSNPYGSDTRMTKYVALLKEICERRSIPFLDLYHCSNLRPWDDSFLPIAYSKDNGGGVHPNEVGHQLIANRFKIFVESIM